MTLERPLSSLRILDLSRVLAGPFATMILGDLGAEIIKVEPPKGDYTRYWAPIVSGVSVYYLSTNRNKRSIVINLMDDRGREILYRLVRRCDVFIENFRSDVPRKLGIDYESIRKIKPEIIYCSIHGFEPGSKYDAVRAGDLIIQAMSGLMDTTGDGEKPVRVSFALFDIYAGMVAAISILSALLQKMDSGRGAKIDINLYDTSLYCMSYIPMIYLMAGVVSRKMGSAHPSIVPYQAFLCKDGRYIAVGVFSDGMWMNLCSALGLEKIANDIRFKTNVDRVENRDVLIPILEKKFLEHERDYWIELLSKYGVSVGPVYSLDEVFEDTYVTESGIVERIHHPLIGMIPQITYPGKINGARPRPTRHPPLKGEHTIEIMGELGYSMDEIKAFLRDGVIESVSE